MVVLKLEINLNLQERRLKKISPLTNYYYKICVIINLGIFEVFMEGYLQDSLTIFNCEFFKFNLMVSTEASW